MNDPKVRGSRRACGVSECIVPASRLCVCVCVCVCVCMCCPPSLQVFVLNLVQDCAKQPQSTLSALLQLITPTLRVPTLFNPTAAQGHKHILRGIVCYSGLHYIAFFANNNKKWTYCDDTVVKEVGHLSTGCPCCGCLSAF